MADRIRLRPTEVTRLAGSVMSSSQQVGDGMRDATAAFQPPSTAFGNSPAAAALSATVNAICDDATLVVGRLVGVLEGDVDRLYRLASALQDQDDINAARMRMPDPTGGPRAW